jgi:hypothetical protein
VVWGWGAGGVGGGGSQAAHRVLPLATGWQWGQEPPRSSRLSFTTELPQPFPSRRKPRALDRPSGMQPRDGAVGTSKISLLREIIGMIEAKGLSVSAALFLLAASEIPRS